MFKYNKGAEVTEADRMRKGRKVGDGVREVSGGQIMKAF